MIRKTLLANQLPGNAGNPAQKSAICVQSWSERRILRESPVSNVAATIMLIKNPKVTHETAPQDQSVLEH